MPAFPSSCFSVFFLLAVIVELCAALNLEEIRPWSPHGVGSQWLGKRDNSVFDLKSTETFLWGAEDGTDATLGNLTVFTPGSQENILAMEKFDGLLTSVQCNDNGLSLTFEDDSAFAYAQRVWDWVNGADDHTFLMVAGKGDCGDNPYRIPYLVSKIDYDKAHNTAKLTATAGSWKSLIHSYELHVGRVPMSNELGLERRDYTKDASFDLSTNFNSKLKVKTSAVFGELVCNPCGTSGRIKFEFIAKTKFLVPVDLIFKMSPEAVKAEFDLSFELASDYGSKHDIEKRWTLGKIPLAGVAIPGGVLTLGPVIDFQVGIEITGFEVGVKFLTGATATLPDNAILQADLLHPENNQFSGWMPSIDAKPITAQGRASSYVKLFVEPTLQLEGEALGFGFGTGLRLKMPFLEGRGEVIASPGGGACEKGDHYEMALRFRASWGCELKFNAGRINGEQKVDITLGRASKPIGDPLCLTWAEVTPSDKPTLPAPSKTATPGPGPTPSGSPGADTCTANGKSGTCIATASCKSSGGTSTPGYCPKDPNDVQCCTKEESTTPETCKVGSTSGTCISTSSCKGDGGKSTPGLCPGSADIQCCTKPTAPAICKADSLSGTCISTDACKADGGKSTAGLCPGADNIQCCTKPVPETCKVGSTSGTCISTSSCTGQGGTSTSGLCPGPNEIQCCTKPVPVVGGGGCRKVKRDQMGRRVLIPC